MGGSGRPCGCGHGWRDSAGHFQHWLCAPPRCCSECPSRVQVSAQSQSPWGLQEQDSRGLQGWESPVSTAEYTELPHCRAGDSLLPQRQQPSSATRPHPPHSCTGLGSWCWPCWAPRQPTPGSQHGLDHCHPAPHGPPATIPSVLLHPVLLGEDTVCPCRVPCLCWQPCLPCPSWCSSSQAMARLGWDVHTQQGEYQHAQEWELLPLWSCGRNDAT